VPYRPLLVTAHLQYRRYLHLCDDERLPRPRMSYDRYRTERLQGSESGVCLRGPLVSPVFFSEVGQRLSDVGKHSDEPLLLIQSPRKLLSSCLSHGGGKRWAVSSFSGSVVTPCGDTICPRHRNSFWNSWHFSRLSSKRTPRNLWNTLLQAVPGTSG
jgi:hypothetical protein